ncbi:2-amino-4-hydroxy-6-hydroxymethyldihydropteridine diphosphokinase [Aestuariibacter sp. AA17]|uniref:2-amino-4-hydroxy-6-hydroxymethyldihydropteridine diphosphokinase n=1 Tax=Fluctibacter corallii TaxID=2984329 RepID=A0ABT3A509_9ALTE|nr:2-amino-4-hydroxy-6-hydroxymethyldihydropteridine diphosphokinase [Aestuariibacter sp. AA17]MCV2883342.1 2-amino-4-hydroxy-6-hydroxymethyldihydropteridine diphosphokinase [Aestuariibacter sp. AA17]
MHQIYISVGSNVDRETNTRNGVRALLSEFENVEVSTVYESEAVGFNGNPFYNLVVKAATDKSLEEVEATLKGIESENGRQRGEKKFAPRTLDLDLLFYDRVVCDAPVQLPRDEICTNAFVLLPLSELAPEMIHPVTDTRLSDMWKHYHNPKQKLWAIDFNWSDTLP